MPNQVALWKSHYFSKVVSIGRSYHTEAALSACNFYDGWIWFVTAASPKFVVVELEGIRYSELLDY